MFGTFGATLPKQIAVAIREGLINVDRGAGNCTTHAQFLTQLDSRRNIPEACGCNGADDIPIVSKLRTSVEERLLSIRYSQLQLRHCKSSVVN